MMLTEQEAKERWCPFARYAVYAEAAANRWKQSEPTPHALNPVPCRCIGSACMAWRWFDDIDEDGKLLHYSEKNEFIYTAKKLDDLTQRRGYCGLAGKVEL